MESQKKSEILELMLLYSKQYLGSGGPTSRLEESLSRLGDSWKLQTEAYGTPTGIFITVKEKDADSDPKTALVRIKEAGTDLGRLCKLEKIYIDLLAGSTSPFQALQTLKDESWQMSAYSKVQMASAAFLAGFGLCYTSYQKLVPSLLCATITAMIWFLSNVFFKRHLGNPIFTDFASAFFTLVLAAICQALVFPLSIEAYALGGIVLLVPGLALTTSISELADQNLVSGTAKFMQAILALLALGLAYLLFQQFASSWDLQSVLQPVVTKSQVKWISLLGVALNVSCFGIIFKVPPKALAWSTLTGLCGWAVLDMTSNSRLSAAAPFLASVVVGNLSLTFGRVFRLPSQVYSVPGIVAMLPGMLALNSVRFFASGDQDTGISFLFKVAVTAVSIVFGLMTARIPFQIGSRYEAKFFENLRTVWKK